MNKQEEKQGRGCYGEGLLAEPVQSKISKLAILSLLLGIFSLFFFVLAGMPAIVIGIIGILRIKRSGDKLRGKYIAMAGMNISIVFMCIFYLFWRIDAPPIPNDYTIEDLRSAPPEYAESFEVLKTLIDEDQNASGFPAIELTESDSKLIAEIRRIFETGSTSKISKVLDYYGEEIRQIWADNKTARDVIHRLNEFPEIADLVKPDFDYKPMLLRDLVELTCLYEVYVHLQTERDDIHTVTEQLIEIDSVFRKLSLNVRPLIGKYVCYFCLKADLVTANAIANNPEAARESVEMLAGHFRPLTKEQLSSRNSVLFEYLINRNNISEVLSQNIMGKTRLLKKNSTLRFYRNCCDIGIETLDDIEDSNNIRFQVWPSIYPCAEPVSFQDWQPLPLLYICYNPVGSSILRIRSFQYESMIHKKTASKILDDLLQIVLNKRLGKEVSLKAHAYGDEYIIDIEKGRIFSLGPDGKADTRDDIKLRINPEVLGWRN